MNTTTQPGPLEVRLSDLLGLEAFRPVAWARKHPDGTLTDELLPDARIEACRTSSGAWEPLYTKAAAARTLAHAKEVHATSEHMHDRNNALRLYVSDLTAVMLRMVAGIDHLAEIARQWEPDHSSGADRRGWLLAKDARDDAWRLLQEHAQRIGPNVGIEPPERSARMTG